MPGPREFVVINPAVAARNVSLQHDRHEPVLVALPYVDRERRGGEIHRVEVPLPEHHLHVPVERLVNALLCGQLPPLQGNRVAPQMLG